MLRVAIAAAGSQVGTVTGVDAVFVACEVTGIVSRELSVVSGDALCIGASSITSSGVAYGP